MPTSRTSTASRAIGWSASATSSSTTRIWKRANGSNSTAGPTPPTPRPRSCAASSVTLRTRADQPVPAFQRQERAKGALLFYGFRFDMPGLLRHRPRRRLGTVGGVYVRAHADRGAFVQGGYLQADH